MLFDRKYGIGDLLLLVVAISGFIGLYIQAHSVSIAEKELNTKVIEIEKIVSALENEKLERMSGDIENYYSNRNTSDTFHTINSVKSIGTATTTSSLARAIVMLSDTIESSLASSETYSLSNLTLIREEHNDLLHWANISGRWSTDILRVNKENDEIIQVLEETITNQDELSKALNRQLKRYVQKHERINQVYAQKVINSYNKYKQTRKKVQQALRIHSSPISEALTSSNK